MRKIIAILFIIMLPLHTTFSQDRVDSTPASLSYKSQELKKALYWSKSTKTGKWSGRKNTTRPYLGEGVHSDNFNAIFIGDYSGFRYLFLDYWQGEWRYPNLKQEWLYYRYLFQGILSAADYNRMDSLSVGEVLTICPIFYSKMFKGGNYSFPLCLTLTEELRSASETLYKSYQEEYSESYAKKKWHEDYPLIHYICLKRTMSNGKDVVRFRVYPHALSELIDVEYFEIEYSEYRKLFIADKKKTYK